MENNSIFALKSPLMQITTEIDSTQTDDGDRSGMALCPSCGQKLMKVDSLFHSGIFRLKCRRCKKYIRVAVNNTAG